jgi:hypothetical protein
MADVVGEAREFQTAAYGVMSSGDLDTPGRTAAMMWLLNEARSSSSPELNCRAVERALVESTLGRSQEAWYWEAETERAIAREREELVGVQT